MVKLTVLQSPIALTSPRGNRFFIFYFLAAHILTAGQGEVWVTEQYPWSWCRIKAWSRTLQKLADLTSGPKLTTQRKRFFVFCATCFSCRQMWFNWKHIHSFILTFYTSEIVLQKQRNFKILYSSMHVSWRSNIYLVQTGFTGGWMKVFEASLAALFSKGNIIQ